MKPALLKITCFNLLLLFCSVKTIAQCSPGDITFTTQAQINAFETTYSACNNVTLGNLTIGYISGTTNSDITDVTPLQKVSALTGNLIIRRNPNLVTLNGLQNITTFSGDLRLDTNAQLLNITALSGITSVRYLNIRDNSVLQNLTGLHNLTAITGSGSSGYFYLFNNPQLTNLDTFQSLTSVGTYIQVQNNASLQNLDGLSHITSITTNIHIENNAVLSSIWGFRNISATAITGTTGLLIRNNSNLSVCNLPNFCAYLANPSGSHPRTITGNKTTCLDVAAVTANCAVVCPTGDLTFTTQEQINAFATTYAHCSNITVNSLTIGVASGTSNITDLTPLQSITAVQGAVTIQKTQLQNFAGLSALLTMGGNLIISENSSLISFQGLTLLNSIGGYLRVQSNSSLTNLDGLGSVTTIGGGVIIQSNASLTQILGLSQINPFVQGTVGVEIQNNPNLSVCNLPNLCTYLKGFGNRTISGNAANCIDENIITRLTCCSTTPFGFTISNINSTSVYGTWSGFGGSKYELEWGPTGFVHGTGTMVTDVNFSFRTITGFMPNTSYQIYVRQVCPSMKSNWSAPVSFTTLACPIGDLVVSSQADIDSFGTLYQNCLGITLNNLTVGQSPIIVDSNITSLTPLQKITSLTGSLTVRKNPGLTTLNGLHNITSFGGGLRINENLQLQDISALSAVTSVSYVYIRDNAALQSLTGLQNLTTINGSGSNGYLDIYNNPKVTNLTPLLNLTTVGSYIRVQNNALLQSLDGLTNVNSINGYIHIEGNAVLSSITGLSNIPATSISGTTGILIKDNPNLSVCNIPNFCTYFGNPSGSHPRTISGNKTTCLDVAAVTADCIACNVPINVAVANMNSTSANLTWQGDGNVYDIEWGLQGFDLGTGTQETGLTISNYTLTNLTTNSTYDFYVRQNCTVTADGYSGWIKFTFQSYCVPISNSWSDADGYSIRSLSTSGGLVNIHNLDSGFSPQGYADFTAIHSVSQSAGETLFFTLVPKNVNLYLGLRIWIDKNLNGVFETSEIMYSNPQYYVNAPQPLFTLPPDMSAGDYLMRVMLTDPYLYEPCANNVHGETEDYRLTIVPEPACSKPTSITATSSVIGSTTLNWSGIGTLYDIEWGLPGFALGTGTQQTGLTSANYVLTGLAENTAYDFFVRQYCVGTSGSYSNWTAHRFTTLGYCVPWMISGSGISSFSTTGGVTNISNTNSGFSSSGYGNFSTTHSVSQHAGEEVSFLAALIGSNVKGLQIWIDKNNNGTFDTNEIVYTAPQSKVDSHSGSFLIPIDMAPGNYRVRVVLRNGTSASIIPCENNYIEGETEDYTLTLLQALPCTTPSQIKITNVTLESAVVNWTGNLGNTYDIEWGIQGFTPGAGTQQTGISGTSFALSGLAAETFYDFYVRQNCSSDDYSQWAKHTFRVGYCIPQSYTTSNSLGVTISSFSAQGITNISNLDSGYSPLGFGDYTESQSVSQIPGAPISFAIKPGTTARSKVLRIWIDYDKNGVFDNSEAVYTSANFTSIYNGSFNVNANVSPGNYRMRIMMNYTTTPNDPCSIDFYGEAEDYMLNVLAPLPCQTVSGFTATNITAINATINWSGTNSQFDVEWGLSGFTLGTGTQQSGITTASYDVTGLSVNSKYDFYVRQDCTNSADGYSYWAKYTFATVDYCKPASYSNSPTYGITIDSFTTAGGTNNINNLNSGYSPLGYGDFTTAHSISQYAGETVSFSAVPNSTSYNYEKGINIWIDTNKNGVFETSEIVYTAPGIATGTLAGTFMLPSAINPGNYRMRVIMKYNSTLISPCEINFHGEAEDYTLTVLNVLPCTSVNGLTANNPDLSSAQLNWGNSGTFDIEYGLTGFTLGTGTTITGITETHHTVLGLADGAYDFYIRQDCTSDSLDYSNWTKISLNIGYCLPNTNAGSLSDGDYIASFSAEGANAFYNAASYSTGGYGNFSSTHNISQFVGDTLSFTVVPGGNLYDRGVRIWIDWNKDGVFQTDEIMFTSAALSKLTQTGSFLVPNEQSGNYRMRVILKYDETTGIGSCDTGFFGEAEDYTFTVLPAGSCATTTWNGSLWSNGVPNMNRKAIINAALTLVTSLEACELQLTANGKLTIPPGINVTVKGQIVNQASVADLIVASDANLIQIDDVANTGAITVRRNSFPLYRQDYTLWSSPVASQNLRNFSTQTLFNRFYSYDTEAGTVGEYAQEIFTNSDMQNKVFNVAQGYLIRMPNNWPVFVSNAIAGTSYAGEFKGVPNNGSISIPISASNTGMNLVGNPFPSAISISDFFAANPAIDQTIYFWRKRNGIAGSGYATYTDLGLASPQPEIDGLQIDNTISAGQGFFIKSIGATTVQFNNSMRAVQNGVFMRSATEKHRLWLNLSDNSNVIGQTLLGYTTNATQGFDNGLDGVYFNESATALTSLIDNTQYAVQARSLPFSSADVVPLSFKTDLAGSYSISLANFDGLFADGQNIYLKDELNAQVLDLKVSAYTFASEAGVFDNRFSIVYESVLSVSHPQESNAIIVYKQNKELHFHSGNELMEKVEVFDIRGRLIYTLDGISTNATNTNHLNITNQALIVRIHIKDNRIVTKKIIY